MIADEVCPDLAVFAKLGSAGQYRNNMNRDLLVKLGNPEIPCSKVMLPVLIPPKKVPKRAEQTLVLPHLLAEKFAAVGGSAWHDRIIIIVIIYMDDC